MQSRRRGIVVLLISLSPMLAARSAEARLQKDSQTALDAGLKEWAGTNKGNYQLPATFDPANGSLTLPTPTSALYTYRVPKGQALADDQAFKSELTKLVGNFLASDAQQYLAEALPTDEQRKDLLGNLAKNLTVKVTGETPPPPPPPHPPKASEQVGKPSRQGLPGAAAQSLASGQGIWLGETPVVAPASPSEGYELFWAGRYAEAASRFRAGVTRDRYDALAWYFLALSERAAGDPWQAEQSLRSGALAEVRGHRSRDASLGLTRIQGSDREWIESARTLASQPRLRESLVNAALGDYRSGSYLSAADRLRAVVSVDPDNALAWYYLALSERAMGDTAQAEQSLRHGARAEARGGQSRDASLGLTSVQGPDRQWLDAGRTLAAAPPARDGDLALARHRR